MLCRANAPRTLGVSTQLWCVVPFQYRLQVRVLSEPVMIALCLGDHRREDDEKQKDTDSRKTKGRVFSSKPTAQSPQLTTPIQGIALVSCPQHCSVPNGRTDSPTVGIVKKKTERLRVKEARSTNHKTQYWIPEKGRKAAMEAANGQQS